MRSAYLRKVKEFPPDRSPNEFEQVRDAYEMLRDRRQRVRHFLFSIDPRVSIGVSARIRYRRNKVCRTAALACCIEGEMTLMEIDTEKLPQAEVRARLLSQFERWLDSALAEEAPPEGVTANLLAALDSGETLPPIEGQSDLYSLWSAMTALTQEVKIQSRTFRQLNDTLTTKLESVMEAAQGSPSAARLPAMRVHRIQSPGWRINSRRTSWTCCSICTTVLTAVFGLSARPPRSFLPCRGGPCCLAG